MLEQRCIVQLELQRKLLRPDFQGFRLSVNSGSPSRHNFPARPPSITLPHHSSLLHARLHALHNALHFDPNTSTVYYTCHRGQIWCITYRDSNVQFIPVLVAPIQLASQEGSHPSNLIFCGPHRALFSDGADTLILFSTEDRGLDEPPKWNVQAKLQIQLGNIGFTILDARADSAQNIHCLIYRIEPEGNLCVALIDWIILTSDGNSWQIKPHRKLKGSGVIHYCVLESDCSSIYVAAERPVQFLEKPSNGIADTVSTVEKKIFYSWMQNAEDITLTLKLETDHQKTSLTVESLRDTIDICYGVAGRVKGKLFGLIDHELTTWNVDDSNKLNVLLLKREPGVIWPSLLKDGDGNGEQIMDPSYVAEVHSRLAHLCSETEVTASNDAPLFNSQQLEECDFVTEEESCLLRFESETYKLTHQVFLSAHQVILNVHLDSSEVLALALRHDADACVWQPYKATDTNVWPIRHEGTLHAFGYIQSSKQQKKYTVCSPNLNYSVVCESNRHAFIYQQESTSQQHCQLRRRTTSGETHRVNVGKQQLISFERDEEVLGICATNEVLFILTDSSIITMSMTE